MDAFDELGATPPMIDKRAWSLRYHKRASATQWSGRSLVSKLAAAIVVVAMLGGAGLYFMFLRGTEFDTSIGERRIVQLSDGSRISLDSDSQVHVSYAMGARSIVLDKGRARFDVTHDVTRPFTVRAGTETVVAVGTIFDVEKLERKVVVTLIQGRVVVKNGVSKIASGVVQSPAMTSLNAGQALVASAGALPTVNAIPPVEATAWEGGRLMFHNERLEDAVARVNRYTDHPIKIDPTISDLRVSGIFNAGDVSSFVGAVTSYFAVDATTDSDNQIILQHKS
jgi:transmembrane sensor